MIQLRPEEIIHNDKHFNQILSITLLSAAVLGFALGFFTGYLLK